MLYKALARMEHQRPCRQAPLPEPKTSYWLAMEVGRRGAENKGKQEGTGAGRSSQPSGGPRIEEGQTGRSGEGRGGDPEGQATGGAEGRQREGSSAAAGRHVQREEERGVGGSKDRQREREVKGTGRKADRRGTVNKVHEGWERGTEGCRGRDRGSQGNQESEARGRGRQGNQGREARHKGRQVDEDTWGHRCTRGREGVDGGGMSSHVPSNLFPHHHTLQLCRCTPPPPMYPGALPPAPMQQHPKAGGAIWGTQRGKGEELRRAWERIGEEERRLQESEARAMGEVAGVAEGRARAQGTARGGEAHAVMELQRAWADIRTRLERLERAEQDNGGPGVGAQLQPLQPFKQPAISPEVEMGVQERAWKRIRGEAVRLEERGRECGGTGP